jgi:hypothetical protein
VDNWGLLYARFLAEHKGVPLAVCFNMVPRFLEATLRQYGCVMKSPVTTHPAGFVAHDACWLRPGSW